MKWLAAALVLAGCGSPYGRPDDPPELVHRPPEGVAMPVEEALGVVAHRYWNSPEASNGKDASYFLVTTRGISLPGGSLRFADMAPELWKIWHGRIYVTWSGPWQDGKGWHYYLDSDPAKQKPGQIEFARRFCDAVAVLKRLPENSAFDAVDPPRLLWKEGKREEARQEARKALEYRTRWASTIGESNLDEYFDFPARYRKGKEALDEAARLEKAGDLPGAFRAYEKAWGWTPDLLGDAEKAKDGMIRLYPGLASKPGLPEAGRRYYLKGEDGATAKEYHRAWRDYGALVDAFPWCPDGWYNLALVQAATDHFINYQAAVESMRTYLRLAPDSPDARAAQDMIYRWEGKAKK